MMNQLLTIFFCISILACNPQTKPSIKVESNKELEEKYTDYNFKVYSHKDSIEVMEWVESFEGDLAILIDSMAFLYQDSTDKMRVALDKNDQWHTWEIFEEEGQAYYATIRQQDFDGIGSKELVIESIYGLSPQSTFGESYYGSFSVWNTDSIGLYFEIENYYLSNDMGRNGDHSYSIECRLEVTVEPKIITVTNDEHNKETAKTEECFEDSEELGVYCLIGGVVQKSSHE